MMKQEHFGKILLVGLVGSVMLVHAGGVSDQGVDMHPHSLENVKAIKLSIQSFCEVLEHGVKGEISQFGAIVQNIVAAEGKPYKDQNGEPYGMMSMLNSVLVSHPVGLVRIELAYRATAKAFKELPSLENSRKAIDQKMTYILAPVKEFFGEVHNYSNLLIPLVKMSLGVNHATGISEKDSLLLIYLTGKEHDAGRFFANHVTTLPQLVQAAYEFIIFFKDMKASFTPEAKAAGREYMKLVEQNKRAVAAHVVQG